MFLSNYGAQDKLFIIRSFLEIMLHHATGTSIYRYLEFTLLTFSALAFGFLITSASFPMSLQQLFLIRGPSFLCARVSMVTFSDEAPGQRKSSAVKIKTFCRSPINHSVCRCLSSIVGLHVNEQIETILNLGYRQAISGRHCSTSGDCR